MIIAVTIPVVVIVGLLVVLLGRGESDSPGGFLSAAGNEAVFIQWTRSENTLTGSIQVASLPDDNSRDLETRNLSFTGILSDGDVTLNVGSMSWLGRLSGSDLRLTFPTDTGALETTSFRKASVDDYNSEISRLRERSHATADNAEAIATEAALYRAASDADAAVSKTLDGLNNEVDRLAGSYSDLDAKMATVDRTLQRTQSLQSDALTMARKSPISSEAAYDAQSKAYDVQTAFYDTDTARLDVESIKSAVDGRSETINKLISKLREQHLALESTVQSASDYRPNNSADLITSQVAAAETAVKAAQSTTADKAKTAQTKTDKAKQLSGEALRAADEAIKRSS